MELAIVAAEGRELRRARELLDRLELDERSFGESQPNVDERARRIGALEEAALRRGVRERRTRRRRRRGRDVRRDGERAPRVRSRPVVP